MLRIPTAAANRVDPNLDGNWIRTPKGARSGTNSKKNGLKAWEVLTFNDSFSRCLLPVAIVFHHPRTGGNEHMTKAELIEKMAKEASITKAAAGTALDSFLDGVTKALKKKDGKVTLVGFGTFSKARRKARKGRNPQTGEAIKIKAKNVVKFKAGKKLQDAV
jgi:DNA-binding protein HU-beta